MRGPAATPCTPARRGRTRQAARDLNTANMADSYFHAQSEKVRWRLRKFCIAQIFKSAARWPLVLFVQILTTCSNYFEVLTSFPLFAGVYSPIVQVLSLCPRFLEVLTSWHLTLCADVDLSLYCVDPCSFVWRCWPLSGRWAGWRARGWARTRWAASSEGWAAATNRKYKSYSSTTR